MNPILFIRHAETDLAGTFCGHSDPPVNSTGREQIAALIASLAGQSFDAIYTSDLRRAVETATAFAVPIVKSSRLREIHFGKWEGLTWAEIEQRDPAYAQSWVKSFPALPAPGGEVFESFERRIVDKVNHLISLAGSQRIAVVTHAGVMRVVLRTFLKHTEQEALDRTKSYCSSFRLTLATPTGDQL